MEALGFDQVLNSDPQISQITQIRIESRSADPIARPAPVRRGISASMPQHLASSIWNLEQEVSPQRQNIYLNTSLRSFVSLRLVLSFVSSRFQIQRQIAGSHG